MGVIAVLLAVALGSTGYYDADYTHTSPAQCFLTHDFANLEGPTQVAYWGTYGYGSLYMTIVLCFLSFSYLSRVVQVFPSAQAFMRNLFRSRPSKSMQRWLESIKNRASTSSTTSASKFWLSIHRLLLSIYCLSKAAADLYGSLLWEVCLKQPPSSDRFLITRLKITWLALASAWGTIVIWRDRGGSGWNDFTFAQQMTLSEDNTWGFGQVFPLLLLILPLVSFFEAVYGKTTTYY